MTDTDLALALAAAFAAGCAAIGGLRRYPEAMIRALSVITLGFGLFLAVALASTAPGKPPHGSVAQTAARTPR